MSLIKEMHSEMHRLVDLKKEYDAIPEGFMGGSVIQASINGAEKAIEENDPVKMLMAYEDMKKCTG